MMKYKEDKMDQCKIKPWNIRKLHFAIDQLQGAGKRRDRRAMHHELDAMTDGDAIPTGAKVKVVGVEGNMLTVTAL